MKTKDGHIHIHKHRCRQKRYIIDMLLRPAEASYSYLMFSSLFPSSLGQIEREGKEVREVERK